MPEKSQTTTDMKYLRNLGLVVGALALLAMFLDFLDGEFGAYTGAWFLLAIFAIGPYAFWLLYTVFSRK